MADLSPQERRILDWLAAHRPAMLAFGLAEAGGLRIDLVTDSAEGFYRALSHRPMAGYRLHPPF